MSNTTTNFDKEVLTIAETMEYLSMSKGTILRLVREKVFTAKKLKGVKGRTFFLKSEILAAMKDKDELITEAKA